MADAFELMSQTIAAQGEVLEKLVAKAGTVAPEKKEQARSIPNPRDDYEASIIPTPAKGAPVVIYKCGTRGLKLVIRPSGEVTRPNGGYRTIPPLIADFENGTFRTSDPKTIEMVDDKIEDMVQQGKVPIVVKFKDEIAEALAAKSTDVTPIKTDKADMELIEIIS